MIDREGDAKREAFERIVADNDRLDEIDEKMEKCLEGIRQLGTITAENPTVANSFIAHLMEMRQCYDRSVELQRQIYDDSMFLFVSGEIEEEELTQTEDALDEMYLGLEDFVTRYLIVLN